MFYKKDYNKKIEFKSMTSLHTIIATLIESFIDKHDGMLIDKKNNYEYIKKDLIIPFVKENTFSSVNMMLGLEELDMEEVKKLYFDFLNKKDENDL